MTHRHAVFAVSTVLAVVAAGCGSGPAAVYPAASGRRVQSVAVNEGSGDVTLTRRR